MGTLCSTARRAARLFPTQCVRAPIPACPPTPAVFWVFVLTTAGPAGLLKARFQAARPHGPAVSRPPSQGRGRASESLEKRMALPTVGSVCVSVGAGGGVVSHLAAQLTPHRQNSAHGSEENRRLQNSQRYAAASALLGPCATHTNPCLGSCVTRNTHNTHVNFIPELQPLSGSTGRPPPPPRLCPVPLRSGQEGVVWPGRWACRDLDIWALAGRFAMT